MKNLFVLFFYENLERLEVVNVWGKRFKLPQLTHESLLTTDHSCKLFFWYLPNWTSTDLWFVVLYITFSRSGLWLKISHVLDSCASWNVFPTSSILRGPSIQRFLVRVTKNLGATAGSLRFVIKSGLWCRIYSQL